MSADVTLVAGLGYGDEGKGRTVDHVVRSRRAELVVRYNGGAQAAHNVVANGMHHTFAQFGSGTFAGARTLLSRFVLVNPLALLREAAHLESLGIERPLARVAIDGDALVTTPLHVAMNRLREVARSDRHGSCGMGIGETMQDALEHPDEALRMRDLLSPARASSLLERVRQRKLREAEALVETRGRSARRAPVQREISVLADDEIVATCPASSATHGSAGPPATCHAVTTRFSDRSTCSPLRARSAQGCTRRLPVSSAFERGVHAPISAGECRQMAGSVRRHSTHPGHIRCTAPRQPLPEVAMNRCGLLILTNWSVGLGLALAVAACSASEAQDPEQTSALASSADPAQLRRGREKLVTAMNAFQTSVGIKNKTWTLVSDVKAVRIPTQATPDSHAATGLFGWVGTTTCGYTCLTDSRRFEEIGESYAVFVVEFDEASHDWSEPRRVFLKKTYHNYYAGDGWCNRGFTGTGSCDAPQVQVWRLGLGDEMSCLTPGPDSHCFPIEIEITRDKDSGSVTGHVATNEIISDPSGAASAPARYAADEGPLSSPSGG